MAESALSVFMPSSQFGTHFLSVAHVEDGLEETMNAFDSALHAVTTSSRSV
jgi:glutamate-1-semialdehyde aminotransferase